MTKFDKRFNKLANICVAAVSKQYGYDIIFLRHNICKISYKYH